MPRREIISLVDFSATSRNLMENWLFPACQYLRAFFASALRTAPSPQFRRMLGYTLAKEFSHHDRARSIFLTVCKWHPSQRETKRYWNYGFACALR